MTVGQHHSFSWSAFRNTCGCQIIQDGHWIMRLLMCHPHSASSLFPHVLQHLDQNGMIRLVGGPMFSDTGIQQAYSLFLVWRLQGPDPALIHNFRPWFRSLCLTLLDTALPCCSSKSASYHFKCMSELRERCKRTSEYCSFLGREHWARLFHKECKLPEGARRAQCLA